MKLIRITLVAFGLAALGFGLDGALFTPGAQPLRHFTFIATLVVAHDVVLLPIVLGAGWLIVRFVPPPARSTVQGGLIVSLAVTLAAIPLILGYGKPADNPSALPGNYAAGLLIVLAVVWATVLTIVLVKLLRHKASTS